MICGHIAGRILRDFLACHAENATTDHRHFCGELPTGPEIALSSRSIVAWPYRAPAVQIVRVSR
jgi:hypothetical protein